MSPSADQCSRGLTQTHPERCKGTKSFADDLVLGRGVVIGRAAATLRSVETHPLTRRFVRVLDERISDRTRAKLSLNRRFTPRRYVPSPSPPRLPRVGQRETDRCS